MPKHTFRTSEGLAYHYLKHGHRQKMTMETYAVLVHSMVWYAETLVSEKGKKNPLGGTMTKEGDQYTWTYKWTSPWLWS